MIYFNSNESGLMGEDGNRNGNGIGLSTMHDA